ncbi:MATE family efflux transporter [Glacieibacterium frigidum]|uniref:Uncharacterized protein n=1 Tax=Glacieibacterium frigidum TaxID=2593303 RepID=A0A552UF61_9SPHN|nr:polysaccharide biosynthesis C-terminal domain-containing protein [Glacieibacterium frigidum]TRW16867.1 hypothetical protein FMM06_01265 [Glacieibacterium frigidum]
MRKRFKQATAMLAPGRLGGQTVMAFALKIWGAGASFALGLLIARQFGASGTGTYAIGVNTVVMLSYLVLLGLDYIVVRDASGDLREGKQDRARGAVRSAARVVLVAAPLVAGTLWLLRDWLAAEILRQPNIGPILGIMLWAVIPLALQRIASAALRSADRIIISQIIDGPLGTTAAMIGVGLGVWFGNVHGLMLPATLYVAGLSLGAVVGWLAWRNVSRGWPSAVPVLALPMIAAGVPIVVSNLGNMFTEWYTTVALGSNWPVAVVGYYRAAWQFVALAGLLQVAVETVIGPRIAAAARIGALDEIASVARKSVVLVLVLGGPLFLVLLVIPETLLGLFGPEFRGGATVLQILVVGQFLRLACGPIGSILVMAGDQRWILASAGLAVAVCIIAVALLVPTYGAEGAAWATVITISLRNLALVWVVQSRLGVNLLGFRRPA